MADKLLAEWFWIDRWTGSDAFGMPMEAQGVYRAMLSQAWRRGARLPNDHVAIQRITGCTSDEWARCWPVVERFWRVDGPDLVNDTQLEIYAEAKERQDKASTRGRLGAEGRSRKRISDTTLLTQVFTQAQPKQNGSAAQVVLKDKPPSLSPSPEEVRTVSKEQKQAPAEKAPAPVREFLTWFQGEYQARRHGATYFVRWDVHGALIKRLLTTFPVDRLKKHTQILLTTDEDWTAGTDRGIEILSTKINWLEERLCAWEAKKKARETV